MSRMSIILDGELRDIMVNRKPVGFLFSVWLANGKDRTLLCQVANNGRFGWTVVVSGPVSGLRMVEGFKQRWQAITYAINARTDLNRGLP